MAKKKEMKDREMLEIIEDVLIYRILHPKVQEAIARLGMKYCKLKELKCQRKKKQ